MGNDILKAFGAEKLDFGFGRAFEGIGDFENAYNIGRGGEMRAHPSVSNSEEVVKLKSVGKKSEFTCREDGEGRRTTINVG